MIINKNETEQILINTYSDGTLQQINLLKDFKPGNCSQNCSQNLTVLNNTAKGIVALTNNNYSDYDITVQNKINIADTINLSLADTFQIQRTAERYGGNIYLDYDNMSGYISVPRYTYYGQPGSLTLIFKVIPTAARVVSAIWNGVTIPKQTGITFTKAITNNAYQDFSSFNIRLDQSGATSENPYSADIINDNTKLTINMTCYGISYKYEITPFDLNLY